MTEHKPIFLDRVKANVAGHKMHTPFGPVLDTYATTNDGITLRMIIAKAVPFVIDDDAVEKALEVRQRFLLDHKVPLIDVALIPFSETWIEYSPDAKFAPEERGNPMRAEHTGHLIVRGTHGCSIMTFEGWRKEILTLPYTTNWSFNPPACTRHWYQVVGADRRHRIEEDKADVLRATLLTGRDWMPEWGRRVGGDLVNPEASTTRDAKEMGKQWSTILAEHASVTSLLMSILALIAWCPVEVTEKKPRGMFLHNRKPRPYMEHRLVHLRVPIRKVYAYIKKGAGVVARKRRHRVREHLRVYHEGTPREKRVVIHEHMRGDAALGYVTQEYEVST